MAQELLRAVGYQAWIDRCYLPLVVGIAVAILPPLAETEGTRIALSGGEYVTVARDLGPAALLAIERGELLCLRLSNGVAVTVDFADGRPPLVSTQLPHAKA
jgi:hypothetical protein